MTLKGIPWTRLWILKYWTEVLYFSIQVAMTLLQVHEQR